MKTPHSYYGNGCVTRLPNPPRRVLGLLALGWLILAAGCASTGTNREVKFQQDVLVWKGTATTPLSKKKGETLRLGDEPTLVEAPGYIGVLLMPPSETAKTIDISLRSVQEWGGEAWMKKQGTLINELVANLNEVQTLLKKQQPRVALAKLETLQKKYPKVTYLNFLKVSCLIMMGEMSDARTVLEAALKEFPDDQSGQFVYRLMNEREEKAPQSPVDRGPASEKETPVPPRASAKEGSSR